ncbi:APC family permease [Jiella marina]|uniref:APC family permease n=1 Tax=Jiella sp. LLJ827 TaxID=2917712 RepID=UPI002100B42A|nr:APC family permease [Jiella sp. LLJ827]MCQ0988686.1 APC family permease [Jiella sp. LLJ827]
MNETTQHQSELERSVGLWQLVFYGSGTILGAGIFVVVGKVVGEAGTLTPLAYALAAIVAITSALSFAEMGARIPTAGGPIDYLEQAFHAPALGSGAGWVLMVANTVSAATIVTGFVAYLDSFATVPGWLATTALVLVLGGIAIAGMKESAWLMSVTTLIGIGTLIAVLWALRDSILAAPAEVLTGLDASADGGEGSVGGGFGGLFAGAILAVYAFIGFGDLAQTAEEVRDVKRTLPRAMMISLAIVFVFYILIALALVGTGELSAIAEASAPLVKAVELVGWPGLPIAIASLFVIVNGALTQIIAAARLLLDIARDGRGAPRLFAKVNESTATPIPATLLISVTVLVLALLVPLKSLAEVTSFAILIVFVGVNLSLIRMKRRTQPEDVPNIPVVVPYVGVFAAGAALVAQIAQFILGGG